MKIYKTMRKRGLALFLALTMCLSLIQTTAFANEEAEHVHNEGGWTCAYTDPVTEPACAHEHDAACGYVEAAEEIPCVCTGTDEEGGAVHEDGCAYAPAVEGAPCGHVCGDACVAVVTEGYWECTPPAGEPEDTEPTEDAEAPEEDAEVPAKDAETETPEEVPAEVQAFLDAVAAIPEITAENAAEVAEYVYGPVSEAYDALLGTEYEERDDVMEAAAVYAAALEAVDEALSLESGTFEAGTVEKSSIAYDFQQFPWSNDFSYDGYNYYCQATKGKVNITNEDGVYDVGTPNINPRGGWVQPNPGSYYNPTVTGANDIVDVEVSWEGSKLRIDFKPGTKAGSTTVKVQITFKYTTIGAYGGTTADGNLYFWYDVTNNGEPGAPREPSKDEINYWSNNQELGIRAACSTNTNSHKKAFWPFTVATYPDSYSLGPVVENDGATQDADQYPWQCTLTVNNEWWANKYSAGWTTNSGNVNYGKHYVDNTKTGTLTSTFYWTGSKWVNLDSELLTVWVTCTRPVEATRDFILQYHNKLSNDTDTTEVTNMPAPNPDVQVKGSTDMRATLKVSTTVPKREGYTFMYWQCGSGHYKSGDDITLTAPTTSSSRVQADLYAVWAEDSGTSNAPDAPPKRTDLNGILGNFVKVQCVSTGNGLPHDEKTYNTWTGTVDGQHEASVGKPYQESDTWKVDVTLYGKVYARMYSCEPIFGVGEAHTLAEDEDEIQTITLTWNSNTGKWTSGRDRGTILATFTVICKDEPVSEYEVIYTDGVDGTVFGDVSQKVKVGFATPEWKTLNNEPEDPAREGYIFKGWKLTSVTPNKDGVQETVSADDANSNGEIIYTAQWEKVVNKPTAPTPEDVNKLVKGSLKGAVEVYCKPERHKVGYFDATAGRITIGDVEGDATNGYTCEVTFLAQAFCDAYNTLKGTTTDEAKHILVANEGNKTVVFKWDAETETWTLPAGFKAPVTFYVECPNPEEPVAKIEVKKTNDGFQTDPETGNASVNYTVTVKNVSGFDLYGLKLTDELTPTLTATGEGEPTATYTFSNWKVKTTSNGDSKDIDPYQVETADNKITHRLALLDRNTVFGDQQTVTLTYTVEIKTNNAPARIKLENTATAEYWTAEYTEPQTRAVRADGNDPFPDPSNGSVSSGSSTDTDGPTSGSSAEGTLPQKYTLSYNWDLPKGVTLDKTLPTDTLESRPANSHFTVDTNNKQGDEVTGSDGKTYVFSGWKVPADIQTETEGKYKGRYVMPARDVTITGTWTAKEEKAPAFDPTLLQNVNVKVKCSSDGEHDTGNNWRYLYGQNNGDNWTPWGDEYYTIGSVEKIDGKYQCVVTLKPEKWAEMRIAEFTDDAAGHVFDETAKDAKICVTFTYDPDTESWKSDLKTAVVFIRETLETRTVEIVKAFYGPTQEQVEAIRDNFSITYTYQLNGKTETKILNGKDAVLGMDTFHLFEGEAVVMAWKADFTVNKGSTNDSGFGVISFVESGHHIDGFKWTGNGEGSSLNEQKLNAATQSIGLSNHYEPEAPTPPTEYTVTIRYVDTHGNTVRSDVRVSTTDGGKYDVTAHQVAISGYRCQGADRPLTGTVAGNTTITLTYVKQITVTWVNENGSTVHGPITIDENAPYSNPEGLDENGHWGSPVADANGNITIQWVLGHPATRTVTWLSGYGTNRVLHTGEIPWDTTDVPARLYPSDPYRSGYTFRGWGAPVIGEDGNITITARWQMLPPVTPPSGGGNTGGGTTIPDTQTPLDPGTTIADQDVPLAAPGLNNTDHFDYIKGYVIDGQILVRPEANITRAEVATIFFRLMTKEFREANWATENDFTDVKKGNWYNNAISTCTKAGILKGYEDGTFKPNQTISREEFAAIAARFASEEVPAGGMFKDIAGRWSEKDIERAAAMGWIKGSNGLFRPVDKITRAEVIVIVNRMLDRVPDADHMLPDMKTFADNTPDMWWYADVQEATNSHEYDRAEDGVTGIWTSLLPEQDWAALEEDWATAADANVADVAPKLGAEGEKPEEGAKEPETAGGSDGNGEE